MRVASAAISKPKRAVRCFHACLSLIMASVKIASLLLKTLSKPSMYSYSGALLERPALFESES